MHYMQRNSPSSGEAKSGLLKQKLNRGLVALYQTRPDNEKNNKSLSAQASTTE